jgi:hypothetical protein
MRSILKRLCRFAGRGLSVVNGQMYRQRCLLLKRPVLPQGPGSVGVEVARLRSRSPLMKSPTTKNQRKLKRRIKKDKAHKKDKKDRTKKKKKEKEEKKGKKRKIEIKKDDGKDEGKHEKKDGKDQAGGKGIKKKSIGKFFLKAAKKAKAG